MKKISKFLMLKQGAESAFFDMFKNEDINFLHYIFLPFIDGGRF